MRHNATVCDRMRPYEKEYSALGIWHFYSNTMRRSGKRADIDLDSRPKTTAGGIARLIGANRTSLYRRIQEGKLNLDSIPRKSLDGDQV